MLPFVLAHRLRRRPVDLLQAAARRAARLYGIDVQELNVLAPAARARARAPARRQADLDGGRRVLAARHARAPTTAASTPRRPSCINELDRRRRAASATSTTPATTRSRARTSTRPSASTRRPTRRSCRSSPRWSRTRAVVRRSRRRAARDVARAPAACTSARRPRENPVARFGARFERDLALSDRAGAGHLSRLGVRDHSPARRGDSSSRRSTYAGWKTRGRCRPPPRSRQSHPTAKVFILKAARAVNGRRALDASPMFAEMAEAWQRGMDILAAASGARAS